LIRNPVRHFEFSRPRPPLPRPSPARGEGRLFVALRAGVLRFWIPGQARNDERVSSIAALSSHRRAYLYNPPQKLLRRFASKFYDSGFRVRPGMTKYWGFAGRRGLASVGGICRGTARRALAGGKPCGVCGVYAASPSAEAGGDFWECPVGTWFRGFAGRVSAIRRKNKGE
jgi:hypothetical protein